MTSKLHSLVKKILPKSLYEQILHNFLWPYSWNKILKYQQSLAMCRVVEGRWISALQTSALVILNRSGKCRSSRPVPDVSVAICN
jgi:hypothetical protein